jgi:dephospho-CoA kinase
MISVGLTGGIGSGKSTVADVWKHMGAYVIKADNLAKMLMTHDPRLTEEIIAEFGEESYDADGRLNRAYLAKEAFEKGRVDRLNELVHPAVHRATNKLIAEQKKRESPLFVKEAALLLDHGRPENLDVIVVVDAKRSTRIERIKKRDEFSQDDIEGRMARQLNPEKMKEMADIVIQNDGDVDKLITKAEEVYQQLLNWDS